MNVIDSFNYAIKNVVDNSFYLIDSKEISKALRNSDILCNKLKEKDKEYKLTKEFVLLKKIEELILLLQLEKFLLAKVLKDYFQFTAQT